MRRIVVVVCVFWPSAAHAAWFYDWYCNGNCAPGQLSVKGREGPFGTEEDCEATRQRDPWNQTVREPGNFGNVDACHGSDASSSSGSSGSSGSSRPLSPEHRFEFRILGGARLAAFDDRISSTEPMAGQSPDVLRASGGVDPGWLVAIEVAGKGWSTGYAELAYFRNQVSSQDVRLGGVSGGWMSIGYSRTRRLAAKVLLEGQVGAGLAFTSFTPGALNTETVGNHSNASYVLEASIILGVLPFEGSRRLELRATTCYMDQTFSPTGVTSDEPDFELGRLSVLVLAGIALY